MHVDLYMVVWHVRNMELLASPLLSAAGKFPGFSFTCFAHVLDVLWGHTTRKRMIVNLQRECTMFLFSNAYSCMGHHTFVPSFARSKALAHHNLVSGIWLVLRGQQEDFPMNPKMRYRQKEKKRNRRNKMKKKRN